MSLPLKPHVRAFLLLFLLSPTGDRGSFPSSLPRVVTMSSPRQTLCSGWWEAEPAFGFCHFHLRETSIPVHLGPLGWGVYILAFCRNAQALPHSFGFWLSSHCPEFTLDWVSLIWFGLVGREEVGASNPFSPWVTLPLLYCLT